MEGIIQQQSQLFMKWKMVFNIWYFNGKMLYRISRDDFYQLLWRPRPPSLHDFYRLLQCPRPPSLLSLEKEEKISKNLKKYNNKYEAKNQHVSLLLSKQDKEKWKRLQEEWHGWKCLRDEKKLYRQELHDGEPSD